MNARTLEPVYVDFSTRFREVPDPIHRKVGQWLWMAATHERTVEALTLIGASIRFASVGAANVAVSLLAIAAVSVYLFPFLVVLTVLALVVEWSLIGLGAAVL